MRSLCFNQARGNEDVKCFEHSGTKQSHADNGCAYLAFDAEINKCQDHRHKGDGNGQAYEFLVMRILVAAFHQKPFLLEEKDRILAAEFEKLQQELDSAMQLSLIEEKTDGTAKKDLSEPQLDYDFRVEFLKRCLLISFRGRVRSR